MAYASFWQRVGAALIDCVLVAPVVTGVAFASRSLPVPLALGMFLCAYGLGTGYYIYCHGRFGQTIGKYVLGIRIHSADGGRAAWRAIWLRHAPELLLSTIGQIAFARMYLTLAPEAGELGFMAWAQWLAGHKPPLAQLSEHLGTLWFWSEVVSMLFTKRRQALHDLLAGTVVIRVGEETLAQAPR